MTEIISANIYHQTARESQIQSAICQWLTLMKIPHAVTDAGLAFDAKGRPRRKVSKDGWPDITACVAGRFVAIEAKTATGRLRASQRATLSEIEQAGGIVIIARSLEDVTRILEPLIKIQGLKKIKEATR